MEVFYALLGLILAGSAFGALTQLVGDLGRDRFVADHDTFCIERLHALLSVCLIPASLANLRARRRTDALDTALLAQIPFNASSSDGLSQFRSPASAHSAVYAKLCLGIDVAVAMTRELAVTRVEPPEAKDYEKLAVAWREAVATAIEFEQLLMTTLTAEHQRPNGQRSAILNDMAFVVLEGGWPCVTDDGTITDRAHVERRLSRRLGVNITVTLISGSSVSQATITDVSLSGLRLKSEVVFPTGTNVTVAAGASGLLKGRVAWAAQVSMGVHLDPDCRAAAKKLYGVALQDCDHLRKDSYSTSEVLLSTKVSK